LRFPGFEEEWRLFKLSDLGDVKTGPFGTSLHQHDYVEVGTPIITVEHLNELGIIHKNLPLVSDEDKTRLKSYHLKTGDLVFSRVGSVDRCSIISSKEDGWLFSGRLLRVRFKGQSAAFFNFSFQLEATKNKIRSIAVGQTMPSINTEILKSIELHAPNLNEQEKVSSFLTLIDQRIQAQMKIIEGYRTVILGLQQNIFRQTLKFKDNLGHTFYTWKYKAGGELFNNISTRNENTNLPILAITQDQGAIPRDLIDYQISVTDKSIESYKVVDVGDFIISLRSFQGGIEYSNYKGICSPAYVILRNRIDINTSFYKYYFKTPDYIKLLNKKLEGIRDGKMISYAYFAQTPLPFPVLEEQKKIAETLECIDKKIAFEKNLLKQYNIQKKYLLQNLFI
jgi:type I restriction enzyme S subunit